MRFVFLAIKAPDEFSVAAFRKKIAQTIGVRIGKAKAIAEYAGKLFNFA